jgi:hypothetical protein
VAKKPPWKPQVTQALYGLGHPDATPFFHAVIEDIWRDPETRAVYRDPVAVFRHLQRMAASIVAAVHLESEVQAMFTEIPASITARIWRSRSESMRDAHALRERPVWVAALERHWVLVAGQRFYGPAFRNLLALTQRENDAPDLQVPAPEPRPEFATVEEWKAYRREHWVETFRDEMEAPEPFIRWLEAVTKELWVDPRSAGLFRDQSGLASNLVGMLSVAGLLYVADNDAPKDLLRVELQEHLGFLREHPVWFDVMERHAPLLVDVSWYLDALEALRRAAG